MNEIQPPSPEEIQQAAEKLKKPASKEDRRKARVYTTAHSLALANYLDQLGQHDAAEEIRANALSQEPEGQSSKILAEMRETENKKIEVEAAKKPQSKPNPLFNAIRAGAKTQIAIDKIIRQVDQNKPPSPPSSPNSPTPSGGK